LTGDEGEFYFRKKKNVNNPTNGKILSIYFKLIKRKRKWVRISPRDFSQIIVQIVSRTIINHNCRVLSKKTGEKKMCPKN